MACWYPISEAASDFSANPFFECEPANGEFCESEFWHGAVGERRRFQHKTNQLYCFRKIERNRVRASAGKSPPKEERLDRCPILGRETIRDAAGCAAKIGAPLNYRIDRLGHIGKTSRSGCDWGKSLLESDQRSKMGQTKQSL